MCSLMPHKPQGQQARRWHCSLSPCFSLWFRPCNPMSSLWSVCCPLRSHGCTCSVFSSSLRPAVVPVTLAHVGDTHPAPWAALVPAPQPLRPSSLSLPQPSTVTPRPLSSETAPPPKFARILATTSSLFSLLLQLSGLVFDLRGPPDHGGWSPPPCPLAPPALACSQLHR